MRRAKAIGRRRRSASTGASRRRIATAAFAAVLALATGTALAAPGDLDPTFSGDGQTTIDFGGNEFSGAGASVAVTPDGGSVIVGQTSNVPAKRGGAVEGGIAVAKLQADGSPDPAFGTGGLKVIGHGFSLSSGRAVAVQRDGKIVIGGVAKGVGMPAHNVFEVDRLNADGSPDTSFGNGGAGFETVDFGPANEEVNALAIQDDGKIVAAGEVDSGTVPSANYAVARLEADGTIDTTFSADGKATATFGSDGREGFGVALQADNKVIVAGAPAGGIVANGMHAVRFNADGTVDTSFGQLGEATPSIPAGSSGAFGVAFQPGLGIVLAGSQTTTPGDLDFAVARLDANGAPDHTFGNDSVATVSLGGDQVANGVVVQNDGKIVAGGDNNDALAALRLNADGSLDTGFGANGVATGSSGGVLIGGRIALQPDGRLLVSAATTDNSDLAVARFQGDPTGPPLVSAKCNGVTATKVGTAGPDVLKGTNHSDVFAGLGGNDKISGLGGRDIICGGGGADVLRGGKAKDTILGGGGSDKLFGGPGRDTLRGGPGRDQQHQ